MSGPGATLWNYQAGLAMKVLDPNAAVFAQWGCPASGVIAVGPPTYEMVQEARESVDYGSYPFIRGWRAHLTLVYERAVTGIVGSDGLIPPNTSLETLISYVYIPGYSLWIALHSTDWKRCNLVNGITWQNIGGRNTGLHVELEFAGADVQNFVSSPSGTTW